MSSLPESLAIGAVELVLAFSADFGFGVGPDFRLSSLLEEGLFATTGNVDL